MKPFFNKPRFVTIVAYILLICTVALFLAGSWQAISPYMDTTIRASSALVLALMFVAHTVLPFVIFLVSYTLLKPRRRAERVILSALLTTAYASLFSALFFFPVSIEPLVSLFGQGSYVWLQFWQIAVAVPIVGVVLWGVATKRKSHTWQLSPYVLWIVAMIASLGLASIQQLSTLYYNEGSRLILGSYTDVILLVGILGAIGYLLVRRKKAELVRTVIVLQVVFSVYVTLGTLLMLAGV